jgi:hypothetical protein
MQTAVIRCTRSAVRIQNALGEGGAVNPEFDVYQLGMEHEALREAVRSGQ